MFVPEQVKAPEIISGVTVTVETTWVVGLITYPPIVGVAVPLEKNPTFCDEVQAYCVFAVVPVKVIGGCCTPPQ